MNKDQSLIILCHYTSIYGGNFIGSLLDLEKALNAENINCVYVFPSGAENRDWFNKLKKDGKVLETVPFNVTKKVFISNIESIIHKYNATLLHTHFCKSLYIESLANRNKNLKVFIHCHSDFSAGKKTFKGKVYNLLVYKLCCKNVKFLSVSKEFVKFNQKRITYIPNALSKSRIVCNHIGGNDIRKRYGVKDDEILCEIFGWSPIVKGVDIAVNAVKKANQISDKKIKLAIVCGKICTEEKMKNYIRENTECAGDEDFLLYLPPVEDVFSYHEAADIMLSTSRSEGFSYSVLEMLSLGKQCIISDIPSLNWAKEYKAATFFVSENCDDCAEKIIEKSNGVFLADNLTADTVKNDYDIKNWTDSIIKQYKI